MTAVAVVVACQCSCEWIKDVGYTPRSLTQTLHALMNLRHRDIDMHLGPQYCFVRRDSHIILLLQAARGKLGVTKE